MVGAADLFERMEEVVGVKDWGQLVQLCTEHRIEVQHGFPIWLGKLETLRDDPERLNATGETLLAIAQCFAEQLSDPSYMEQLTGTETTNPLAEVEEALGLARSQMGEALYDAAMKSLDDVEAKLDQQTGPGTEYYRSIAIGWRGEALFNCGKADQAKGVLEKALALCKQNDDMSGIQAYLSSLLEVHRYQGHADEAAKIADQLAELLQDADEAAYYRARADMLRAGEPKNRVVVHLEEGLPLELAELKSAPDGACRFVFERDRLSLGLVRDFVDTAKDKASKGELEPALELLSQASEIDPHDPDPHYQSGLCFVDRGEYDKAIAAYRKTEELAPGWYQCRGDLVLAEQLQQGALSKAAYQVLRRVQDGDGDLDGKIEAAAGALKEFPRFANLWLAYGNCLMQQDKQAEAVDAYRSGLAAEPDVATRTRICAALAAKLSDVDERAELLQQAMVSDGNLIAGAMARLMQLALQDASN